MFSLAVLSLIAFALCLRVLMQTKWFKKTSMKGDSDNNGTDENEKDSRQEK